MNILIIGEHGMVAHVMYMYLKEQGHNVKALSIRDQELNEINFGGGYDLVINCVGILVEESYKNLDKAVLYNAYLPHLLEAYYKDTNTKVIHISTDCVHDGTFYGRSKALGEIENGKDLTLRMSVIGADKNPDGTGLFNWFMKQENEVDGYEYALWNGITTLQLAKSIVPAMRLTGIYNLVPKRGVSKYNLLRMLNYEFDRGLNVLPVEMGTDKRLEPGEGIKIPSYETMIKEMKGWINEHPKVYSHYLCKQDIPSKS